MKKKRERLQQSILAVVDRQIQDNDPPATKETYERLRNQGFADREARKLIGYVVATEVFAVMKEGRRYDEKKYLAALRNLPTLPWEKTDEAE
jgi:hypothetical protein